MEEPISRSKIEVRRHGRSRKDKPSPRQVRVSRYSWHFESLLIRATGPSVTPEGLLTGSFHHPPPSTAHTTLGLAKGPSINASSKASRLCGDGATPS